MQYINQSIVEHALSQVGSRIFSVTFVKRDGSVRKMNARIGVHFALRGGKKTTDDATHQTVWDNHTMEYRCFPKDRVLSLKVAGRVYDA